jgi:hypothetical protein
MSSQFVEGEEGEKGGDGWVDGFFWMDVVPN